MNRIIILSLVLILAFKFSTTLYADCGGCCSWHGGVVCRDGVTMCADGKALSSKCKAKGCNKCGDGNFVKPIIIKQPVTKKSVLTKTSHKGSEGVYIVPFDNEGIEECVCDGILVLSNRGCPCKQPNKE